MRDGYEARPSARAEAVRLPSPWDAQQVGLDLELYIMCISGGGIKYGSGDVSRDPCTCALYQ